MTEYICECEILHTGITAPDGSMVDQWGATVKREEVTRCRDCKAFTLDELDKGDYGCDVEAWCHRHCFSPEPDGFCAWVEKGE